MRHTQRWYCLHNAIKSFRVVRIQVKVSHRYERIILYRTQNLVPKWIKQYRSDYADYEYYHDTFAYSEVARISQYTEGDGTSGLLLNPFDLSYDLIRDYGEIPF